MRSLVFVFFLLLEAQYIMAQNADVIIGKYHLTNKIDIEIFKKNNKYFGKIIKLNNFENGQTTDINNPDETKQNVQLLGMVIIKNLEYDKTENQWINGTMYGAEKGLVFNLKITEYRGTEIEIVGSKFFFWRTLIWKKI